MSTEFIFTYLITLLCYNLQVFRVTCYSQAYLLLHKVIRCCRPKVITSFTCITLLYPTFAVTKMMCNIRTAQYRLHRTQSVHAIFSTTIFFHNSLVKHIKSNKKCTIPNQPSIFFVGPRRAKRWHSLLRAKSGLYAGCGDFLVAFNMFNNSVVKELLREYCTCVLTISTSKVTTIKPYSWKFKYGCMSPVKFATKRIFRIFRNLNIDRMTSFL